MAEQLTMTQVRILAHLAVGASTTDMIARVIGHGWGSALSALVARGLVDEVMPGRWDEEDARFPTFFPRGWTGIRPVRITTLGRRALESWRERRAKEARSDG